MYPNSLKTRMGKNKFTASIIGFFFILLLFQNGTTANNDRHMRETSRNDYYPTWIEGTENFNLWSPQVRVGPGQRSAPRFADLDDDGDLDLVMGSRDGNLHLFWNTGNITEPVWTENTTVFQNIQVYCNGTDSDISCDFSDLDNDDDLDLVVGTHGGGGYAGGSTPATDAAYLIFYENLGSVNNPVFDNGTWSYLKQSGGYFTSSRTEAVKFKETATPRFADIDNDGDQDLFIGEHSSSESVSGGYHNYIPSRPLCQVVFYENTGSSWNEDNSMFSQLPSSDHWAVPSINDLDNDGDLDLTVSYPHTIWYLENIGNNNTPEWASKDETVYEIINDPPQDSQYNLSAQGAFKGDLVDLDNDGDSDFIMGTGSGNLYPFVHVPPIPNRLPTANAGTDSTYYTGGVVMLNGTGSSDEEDCPTGDPNGNILEYEWSIVNDPSASIVLQPSNKVAMPFFIAPDIIGEYEFSLKVNDSTGEWSDRDHVIINISKLYPPVADAGADDNYSSGEIVILNGTGSYDREDCPGGDSYGNILEYEWSVVNDPSNSISLQPSRWVPSPYFVAPDISGRYEFSLKVNDSDGAWSDEDHINIHITSTSDSNTPPYVLENATSQFRIDEDGTGIIDLNGIFEDDEDELVFLVEETPNLTVGIGPDGNATITPRENYHGTEQVTFSANDTFDHEVSFDLIIIVEPTNDAPVIMAVDGKDAEEGMEITVNEDIEISVVVKVMDIDFDTLSYETNDTLIRFVSADNNTIVFTPINEDVGVRFVEINVSDNNGSNTIMKIRFNIRNINDPPMAKITSPENNTEITLGRWLIMDATDSNDDDMVHGDKLTYVWVSDIDGILGYGENINITLKNEGIHTVILTVTDEHDASSQQTITVKVTGEDVDQTKKTPGTESKGGQAFTIAIIVVILVILIVIAIIGFHISKKKKTAAMGTEFKEKEDMDDGKGKEFDPDENGDTDMNMEESQDMDQERFQEEQL